MSTTNAAIEMEAAGLELGQRVRILCPTCQGGSNGAKTLSISKMENGAVRWKCWRNSCPVWGGDSSGAGLVHTRTAAPKSNPYTRSLVPMDDQQFTELRDKIGWETSHCAMAHVRFAPEDSRYAFPIFAPTGERRGHVLRSYDQDAFIKAITHMDNAQPHISWYGTGRTLVVVEDIPSAVRAARYVRAAALCGTEAPPAYINEIAAHVANVVWALDADALGTAIKNNRANQLLFNSSRVLPLPMDLKDMPEKQLASFLKDNVNA